MVTVIVSGTGDCISRFEITGVATQIYDHPCLARHDVRRIRGNVNLPHSRNHERLSLAPILQRSPQIENKPRRADQRILSQIQRRGTRVRGLPLERQRETPNARDVSHNTHVSPLRLQHRPLLNMQLKKRHDIAAARTANPHVPIATSGKGSSWPRSTSTIIATRRSFTRATCAT